MTKTTRHRTARRPSSDSKTAKKGRGLTKPRRPAESKPATKKVARSPSESKAAKRAKRITRSRKAAQPTDEAQRSDVGTLSGGKRITQSQIPAQPAPRTEESSRFSAWTVGAALLLLTSILGYHVVQTHQRLETVQAQINTLREESSQAKRRAAELERTNLDLRAELSQANTERSELQSAFQRAASQIKGLSNNADEVRSLLGQRRAQREALQSELKNAKRKAEQAEVQAAKSQSITPKIQARLEAMQTELKAHRQAFLQATSEAEKFKRQTLSLKADAAKSDSRNDEMERRLKTMQAELEAHQRAALQATALAEEYKKQTRDLKSELAKDRQAREALGKDLEQAKSQVGQLEKASREAKQSLPELAHAIIAYPPHDPKARDYLIRTIAFEAGGESELGKAAVAHVVLNRVRSGKWGNSVEDVVTYPWQFEPWMTRRKELEKLHPFDLRFQKAADIADAVLAGELPDPTAGATHFLNPVVVRQRRGGSLPLWARRKGQPIGRHVFYALNGNDAGPESERRVSAAHPTDVARPGGSG